MLIAIALLLMGSAAGDLQTQGLQALDRQDYRTAETIFSQLAHDDPKDYSAFFNLALAQAALKEDAQATDNFRQTLSLNPNLYEAKLNLGLLYIRNGKAAEAIPLLEDVTKQKPTLPKPHFYLAQALQSQSKWTEAQAHFEDALRLDPKNGRAELGIAEALLHQGKLDDARPHFERAAVLDPALKPFFLELAVALIDAKREKEAISLLEQFPNEAAARSKLGQIYLQMGQPRQAVPQFAAALQFAPTLENRLALATAYMRSNQQPLALPLLKEAVAAKPDDWDLQMTIGRIYRDQRQFPEAARYFAAAAKLKPDAPEAWSELAGVLTLTNDYAPALAALDRLRALNAEKPGHIFLRAIILDKLRQLKPALESYRQFLAADKGEHYDQEFQARGRIRAIEHEVYGR